jgi:hypothetical protein
MSEYKVDITRNGTVLFMSVTTGLITTPQIHFTHQCNTETEAELLISHLGERQSEQIKRVRKEEFFSGWKHAKAKKHGKKWFGWFFSTLVGRATHD